MNLKLRVSEIYRHSVYPYGRVVRFAVVDLDISRTYPANFVCLLPKEISVTGKNKFSRMFGKGSIELAIRLLAKALKTERDSEVKKEIENRLNLLKKQK